MIGSDTQKNVQTVQRMLEAAEARVNRTAIKPETEEQDAYPLTEIREDLDEDGNIICS